MTPRTVPILCERAPVKVNPVPAVRMGWYFKCSYCGRRVQVVA